MSELAHTMRVMKTSRLQAFIEQTGLKPAGLARESSISRQHLLRLRKGTADPTRAVMVAITSACGRLVGRQVSISELFDVGGER